MNRRDLVTLFGLFGGVATAWPRTATAQQSVHMRTIGVLQSLAATDKVGHDQLAVFRQGLRELGWTEGENVQFSIRYADSENARFTSLAAELVDLAPDAILAITPPAVDALARRTRSIPIVFVIVPDPVSQGYVASLARPGGNITGVTDFDFSIGGKWLQLLKEITPQVKRVVALTAMEQSTAPGWLRSVQAAAKVDALETIPISVQSMDGIGRAMKLSSQKPGTGLIFLPNTFFVSHRNDITKLAAQYHLPAVYFSDIFAAAGGLITYASNIDDQFRRAAFYVDRVLRGTKPGDLAVQNPIKYDLLINLKTADALGLTIPQSLLVSADKVIK